ncbi:TolC family protein [Verrucomicrobiota bacterium]
MNILPKTLLVITGALITRQACALSWEECLVKVAAQNPELLASRKAVQQAQYQFYATRSAWFPQLSASASIRRGERETADGDWENTKSTSASLDLDQLIFDGFGTKAKIDRRSAALRIAKSEHLQTCADVELQLRLAYLDVLYSKELVELSRDIEERRRNNVRLVKVKFEGGRENKGSLLKSQAQHTQAQYDRAKAERRLTAARQELAAALGSYLPIQEEATGRLLAGEPDELVDLVEMARATPDYLISETRVVSAEAGVKLARSSRMPKLTAGASAGESGDYDLENGNWSASIRLSMPLFTGGEIRNEIKAAKADSEQAALNLATTLNQLASSLLQRWNSYRDAVDSLSVQQRLLESEELRAKISAAKYQQGLQSYEDWDAIENSLVRQLKTLLADKLTAAQSAARWKNALGKSDLPN